MSRALSGVRILDLSRLAPGPYATMLLADAGAEVLVVSGGRAGRSLSQFGRGKQFISLDLKSAEGVRALHLLVEESDVVVEGFRPGVADRLGAGYETLRQINESIIYCSLTGYGQDGPLRDEAGHDINYLSLTGFLGSVGPIDGPPVPPLNLVADFAGGSMLAAFSIVTALYERSRSGAGRYIDVAMIDGVQSMMTMHYDVWKTPTMPARGDGVNLGSAPFYRCFQCSDGEFVAVGAIEPQFFANLWTTVSSDPVPDHFPRENWPWITEVLSGYFAGRTRDEHAELFAGADACVTPVLNPAEVAMHPHIVHRHGPASTAGAPMLPRFDADPTQRPELDERDRTHEVLTRLGFTASEIEAAASAEFRAQSGTMAWPPEGVGPSGG